MDLFTATKLAERRHPGDAQWAARAACVAGSRDPIAWARALHGSPTDDQIAEITERARALGGPFDRAVYAWASHLRSGAAFARPARRRVSVGVGNADGSYSVLDARETEVWRDHTPEGCREWTEANVDAPYVGACVAWLLAEILAADEGRLAELSDELRGRK